LALGALLIRNGHPRSASLLFFAAHEREHSPLGLSLRGLRPSTRLGRLRARRVAIGTRALLRHASEHRAHLLLEALRLGAQTTESGFDSAGVRCDLQDGACHD
jgi:hypothetical protein